MRIFWICLSVAVLANVVEIDGACIQQPENHHPSNETTLDKVSDFFSDLGCSLKSGAGKVKDGVESGYNYLKTKITKTDKKEGNNHLHSFRP